MGGSGRNASSQAPREATNFNWLSLKFCKRDDGRLDLWTVYEKKPQWGYGKYVGKHEVLDGQVDAGEAYGGQGSFPY